MRSSSWLCIAVAVAVLCVAAVAGNTNVRVGGKRTLVLLQDSSLEKSHSIFFDTLKGRGHELEFRLADESQLELSRFGEWMYDNVIIFAPTAEDFGGIHPYAVVDFIDHGGNVLVAASSEVSEAIRLLAAECGVEFDAAGSSVVDHINYDLSDPTTDHTLVLSNNILDALPIVGTLNSKSAPIAFRGIGQVLGDNNELGLKLLTASSTAYSAVLDEDIEDYPESVGTDTVLVSTVQARNNARATFAGSLYMFSNEAFNLRVRSAAGTTAERSSNQAFTEAVTRWTLQEAGVLRFRDIEHHRADGTEPDFQLVNQDKRDLPRSSFPQPEIAPNSLVYRIKDNILYKIVIEEFDGENWVTYNAKDVQMEFVMLDAYVRTNMVQDAAGTYVADFIAPDVYGVFKFRVMYRRPGLSTLHTETQVSVRPFSHNEYERFIDCAYPYYASAFSMMIGFFVFGIAFLYTGDNKSAQA